LLRSLGLSERLLLERLELNPMRMGFLGEGEVTRIVAEAGCRVIKVDGKSDLETTYYTTRA
jgi:hypothetical protein